MRRLISLVAAGSLLFGLAIGASASAQAGTLSNGGVVVSWDDALMYEPAATDIKTYKFQYANNTGLEVLSLKLTLTDKFADAVGSPDSEIFLKVGQTGFLDLQNVVKSDLTEGLGPYTLTVRVEYWPSSGLSASETTAPFMFLSRTTPSTGETVRCINKKTLKIKTFKGTKCPAGWKKV